MTDSHWVAWAAGIVDGEGSVMLVRNRQSGQIHLDVRVQMTDEGAVRRLELIFGGSVRWREIKKGVDPRPYYTWRVCSERAFEALTAMRPWLVTKGALADVGLEFWQMCAKPVGWNTKREHGKALRLTPVERERRLGLWDQMRSMQMRGEHRRKSG